MTDKPIRIGGASGYWGDSAIATPQLLAAGDLDYIVFDYLAEITMSIMARAKAKNPDAGFATDFISSALRPNLGEISRQGVKLIANAGGVNPLACGAAVRKAVKDAGLALRVAVITGDDLTEHKDAIAKTSPKEMFTGVLFPDTDKIASINAYIGAFPIAKALSRGADIVITGRCVDSAVTLGALIHEFGWENDDWDQLASGSLAGHILECGPQATGGNFTDWEAVPDIANIGYPICEIAPDGSFSVTKPASSGGIVTVGTVAEQMLYEIGDPQAYILPDVICDFSDVSIKEIASDKVQISPAKGRPAPDTYKTSLTYQDGFRVGVTLTYYGIDAAKKARRAADAIFERARNTFRQYNAGDFTETSVEIIGSESQFGDFRTIKSSREVVIKIAAKHEDAMGAGVFLKEAAGLGLATPPGLSGFAGARPKPSPVVRLFSYPTPKSDLSICIETDDEIIDFVDSVGAPNDTMRFDRPTPPATPVDVTTETQLINLAWGRSGDKGDKANIGVIARDPEYLPYIWAALDEQMVADRLAHFISTGADASCVQRYFLPGSNSVNFLIDNVLGGGGVASLRNDPQGKGFAQILLACPIPVSIDIADKFK